MIRVPDLRDNIEKLAPQVLEQYLTAMMDLLAGS